MDTEIVLFLRSGVPEARLQEALAEVFCLAAEDGDAPLVVRYAQGFALGVSVPCGNRPVAEHAAKALSEQLHTAVLLEARDSTQWLLFAPGVPDPLEVEVVELRHGLDVAMPTSVNVRMAAAACA